MVTGGAFVLKIELSDMEFRRLLDMVYIGNWILNSTRTDERIKDYDELESKIFAHCIKTGMYSFVISRASGSRPNKAQPLQNNNTVAIINTGIEILFILQLKSFFLIIQQLCDKRMICQKNSSLRKTGICGYIQPTNTELRHALYFASRLKFVKIVHELAGIVYLLLYSVPLK